MYIMDQEVRTLAPALLLQSELARDGYLRGRRCDGWWRSTWPGSAITATGSGCC